MNVPREDRSGIVSLFVRHRNAANLLMVLMLLAGMFALGRINMQFFPTIETKRITVTVPWSGASAEDIEANILSAIEPEVRFVDGVIELTAAAREGTGSVVLEFDAATDMQKAMADVESAIDQITTLPEDADTPKTRFPRFYERIARLSISGPFSEAAMKVFAKRIRDDLLDRGIDRVNFNGMRGEEIRVDIPERELRRLSLTVSDVSKRLNSNTRDLPSGQVDGKIEKQLRTLTPGEDPSGLASITVKSYATGEQVLLRDIATIHRDFEKDGVRGFAFAEPGIELTVLRSRSTNTLKAAGILKDYLNELRPKLPKSLKLVIYDDRSDKLWQRIETLVRNGGQGLILVVGILFVFLNARIALWVAAGIPVALLATLGVMYASGQTINMLSLFALIMMLGIIVDDAIVVGEHTATRSSMGDDPVTAAEIGAGHMITPVMGASLTTMAAFAPIFLVRDFIGQMMSSFPLVVIAVLTASIIECFLVLPGHLAHSLSRHRHIGWSFWRQFFIALLIAVFVGVIPAGLDLPPQPTNDDIVHTLSVVSQSWNGFEFYALLKSSLRLVFDAFGQAILWVVYGGFALAVFVSENMVPVRQQFALVPLTFMVAVGAFVLAGVFEFIIYLSRHAARRRGDAGPGRFRRGFDKVFRWYRDGPFNTLVTISYHWRYATAAIAIACLMIFGYGFIAGKHIGFVFFPSPEAEVIRATIEFNAGIPEDDAVAGLKRLENALLRAEQTLTGGKQKLVVASFAALGRAGRARGDNIAEVDVQLIASEERDIRTPTIIKAWRKAIPDIVGVKRVAVYSRRGGPPGRDIDIKLKDAPSATLKKAAGDLIEVLSGFPGLSAVADNLPYGKPELVMSLTPRGAALGFTVDDVGIQVRNAFDGAIARRLAVGDEEIVIRVSQIMSASGDAQLRSLELKSPAGNYVPLGEVVALSERQGFSLIQRRNGKTYVSVTADVDFDVTSNQEIIAKLSEEALPKLAAKHGFTYEFSGREEERKKSFADLKLGVVLAMSVIYIILAWIFASYWRPLAVMLIIPFGLVGAVVGHYLMGFNLTILSMIGLLGLSGILVNDSIILVSRIDERLRNGDDLEQAAIGASRDRLRAVLLTSLTTICGLAPLLMETSLQAQFLLPMAITIVFGLAVATALVLFLVPALIGIGNDMSTTLRKLYARRTERDMFPAE